MLIAIDGPSASGKGTLSKLLSKHYNIPRLDTGLLYRKVAYIAKINNYFEIDVFKEENISSLLNLIHNLTIKDEEEDILKNEEIGMLASKVSSFISVRDSLYNIQKVFSLNKAGAILDGRDIGTTICPNANYKFYVTADVEVRATRRYNEMLKTSSTKEDYNDILTKLKTRDKQDKERLHSPLKVAKDAIILDTTNLNIKEVFDLATSYIH
jgi:cytidylate kinase